MLSIVALLGRRDRPTDGVEDYCTFLRRALAQRGLKLDLARVDWFNRGWIPALWGLWRESAAWRESWVLIQYTGMGWSRRGFPDGSSRSRSRFCGGEAVAAPWYFMNSRARAAAHAGSTESAADCQQWAIEKLYRESMKCIFTVPLERVGWLPPGDNKSSFILIGANIPEQLDRRGGPGALGATNGP